MMKRLTGLILALILLAGCGTTRGIHTIPATRDYQQLEPADIDEAASAVATAHRVGAQYYAPYPYFSAVEYLELARAAKRDGDKRGSWDYAALALDYATTAIREGSGIADAGAYQLPVDYEACVAEFNRLKARHAELDATVAAEVAPVLFAHATASLSRAEYELNKSRQWPEAARSLALVEADIDTIWSQDSDGDGVVDMKDGEPWEAEDKDGFEDGDGVPDPDNDGDGILDLDDLSPNEPETRNRWHDADGAPDAYPTLETIYYASGSASITSETRGYLRGIAELLKEWPDLKLHIRGHTDDSHSERYNQNLSQRRTDIIRECLIDAGAGGHQIVVSFYGETEPINVNQSARDKAENRRVDLLLE